MRVLLVLIFLVLASYANDQAVEQSNKLLKLEQQRQEAEQKELRKKPDIYLQKDKKVEEMELDDKTQRCFPIEEIIIENSERLSQSVIEDIKTRNENKCLSASHINAIIKDIQNIYVEHGFVTTRPYLPKQDLKSKKLIIKIVEGVLSDIKINNLLPSVFNLQEITAFGFITGDTLNLRDLEQGLEQLNRLQSNSATLDMIPGEKFGHTNIVIKNNTSDKFHFTYGFDNKGSTSTGKYKYNFSLGMDDLLGINDFFSASINRNIGDDPTKKESFGTGLTYAIVYGYFTLTTSVNKYNYSTFNDGEYYDFTTSGTSNTINMRLDQMLTRGKSSKLNLYYSVTYNNSKNYIEDTLLEASSIITSSFNIGTSFSKSLPIGSFVVGIDYYAGLESFGAFKDSGNDGEPKAQFNKYGLNANYMQSIPIFNQPININMSLNYQYSEDILYSRDQMSVGSEYTVRGYDYGVSGEEGIYSRNDISSAINLFGTNVTLGLFYDLGQVIHDRANEISYKPLSGYGVSLSLYNKNFNSKISWSAPHLYSHSEITIENSSILLWNLNLVI